MSLSSESVKVEILGDEYSIRSDVEIETTRRIAEYVNAEMKEILNSSTSHDKLKVAVLSALNSAGKMFEYKTRTEEQEKTLERCKAKAEEIGRKIDSIMN
jgi:cell division protein ZapA